MLLDTDSRKRMVLDELLDDEIIADWGQYWCEDSEPRPIRFSEMEKIEKEREQEGELESHSPDQNIPATFFLLKLIRKQLLESKAFGELVDDCMKEATELIKKDLERPSWIKRKRKF